MDSIKGIMQKVKMPESMHAIPKYQAETGNNLKAVKKNLEDKINEKIKIYGFIGMEVYDLAKANKIEIVEINSYIEKMDAIDVEIQVLEKQKAELERKGTGKNICVCGYKLKPEDKFCPNCGEVVERDTITCLCGKELSKEQKFCSSCGRRIEDIINAQEPVKTVTMKECICGAKVPQGQFMCLECGRKIED